MVCYYGRQVCKTGLSTNQPGLKMSGIGGFGGSKGAIRRYISRRVVSNLKPCGAISRHGVITGFRTTRCVKRASKCASIAGGVGRKSNPRFSCGKPNKDVDLTISKALEIIRKYFIKINSKQIPILVGRNESLIRDLGTRVIGEINSQKYVDLGGPTCLRNERHTKIITHYDNGSPAFIALPVEIQKAVKFINDLKITGKLKDGVAVEHIIGTATIFDMKLLILYGYGIPVELAPGTTPIYMFMSDAC